MSMYKISAGRLNDFLRAITADKEVFALESEGDDYHLVEAAEWDSGKHTVGAYRSVEPLKSVMWPPRSLLGDAFGTSGAEVPDRKRIVVGVKNCDLASLAVHDWVFLREPEDPYYKALRENTYIVSADCTDCLDVCFCTVVGDAPYPEKGFDLNLSLLPDGVLVETGSEKGEELLKEAGSVTQFLEEVPEGFRAQRDEHRNLMRKKVEEKARAVGLEPGMDFKKAVSSTLGHELWAEFAERCVECGACNLVCCTCHCFLLADGMAEGTPSRMRGWDSCLYRNFARVAGGGNPRKFRSERLYNRFDKKFVYFPEVLGVIACDGCGRCVKACAGRIDIREVLKRAVEVADEKK